MRRLVDGIGALAGSPLAFVGVVLASVACVAAPVLWWRADRLLWWVVVGLVWLVGFLLLGLCAPRSDGARDGVAVVVFVGELVFAVVFGVVALLSGLGGRLAYALAVLALVLAVLSLVAVARGAGSLVWRAGMWPLLAPFLLMVDRVPAGDQWMTIHLPVLLALGVWLVQAGQIWQALLAPTTPTGNASTVRSVADGFKTVRMPSDTVRDTGAASFDSIIGGGVGDGPAPTVATHAGHARRAGGR